MICVIPARGGSRRLPYKNIRELAGRPVIEWVIDAAQSANMFDKIVVSTDDDRVEQVALEAGAVVLRRPPELCGDVPESLVLKHAVDGESGEIHCRIYPFAALLTGSRIAAGLSMEHSDAVAECVPYGHPPQRALIEPGNYWQPENADVRTQDLPKLYHDAATFRFFRVDSLDKPLSEQKQSWIIRSPLEAQDVDTEDDWELLKMKFVWQHL
jgi:N-acylneuraminate cytidylyltransferase